MKQQQSLADKMKVDLIVKPDGELWLFHDEPFSENIEWVEYDINEKTMTFINDKGELQSLGMVITKLMEPCLLNSKVFHLALVENEQIRRKKNVPVILRDI